MLALVAAQRTDLAVELLGDVNEVICLGSEHHPDFADRPIFEFGTFGPGEGEWVACVRIDGAHRGFTSGDVVRVRAVRGVKAAHRVVCDDHLRTHLADDCADVVAH